MFVRAPNPIWYLPDLIGQPLNDEYYAFFLTNTLPYLPQNVYRDPQGMTVWTGDVVQFFPNGTLPDNLYFDPNLVYRIEVRHGNSQTDQLIYEVNNFVPGNGSSGNNSLSIFGADNQVSNTTFAEVFFFPSVGNSQATLTITVAGTYDVAPGWELVLTGSGSTTLTQLVLTGDQDQINNLPFALRVNNNGWTTAYLRQRLNHNGALWAGGAVSMSVTARAQTVSENISLVYSPNPPGVPQTVATGLLGTGDYQVIEGAIDLPASVNSTLSTAAYVDIIIQLPPTGIVDISSVQVLGQSVPLPTSFDPTTDIPDYQQMSEERMIDHLFHFYRKSILNQAKDNLLAGWTFAMNPWQFITKTVTPVAALTSYIADQTILRQETASAYATGQATGGEGFGLHLVAQTGVPANRFAIIQYLDYTTVMTYFGEILSSMVRAAIFTSHGTQTNLKARLIYRTAGDAIPTISNTEPITGWDVNGDLTFAVGWTAIEPLNDMSHLLQTYPVAGSGRNYPEMPFDQFQLPQAPSSTPYLGIVLYITDPVDDTSGTGDSIVFDRVSLVPNDFAIDASTETYDESIRKCQFYYEKSYPTGVLPGTATTDNGIHERSLLGPNVAQQGHPFTMNISYDVTKRAAPVASFWEPDGTADSIQFSILRDGSLAASGGSNPVSLPIAGNFTVSPFEDRCLMLCLSTTSNLITTSMVAAGDEGTQQFQYVFDARLGV